MQLNAKIVDGKSVVQFRKEHSEVRRVKHRGQPSGVNRMASVGALLMDPQNVTYNSNGPNAYGKPNRPQTPVKGIITGDYGQVAESYYKAQREAANIAVSYRLN